MLRTNRLLTLLLLLVASMQCVWADAVNDFVSSKPVSADNTSVLVEDLKTGKTIVAYNHEKPLIPASIMKSVTTATLLEKIGPKFKFETPVYLTGNIADGVVNGNILVVASGDPTINSKNNPKTPDFVTEIVNALKKANIKKVAGSIVIDESTFPGSATNPKWGTGDLQYAYGTGTHGFNFEDNANGKSSVKDPAGVFRTKLTKAMTAAGITLENNKNLESTGARKLLVKHTSATLDEIMRSCMMRSDNQFAETMLRMVGLKYGGEGSSAKGAEEMYKFWKNRRADMSDVVIVDGSGLSRSNRVTTRFMADMLKSMARNPYYASFFPLAGQEGTLKHLMPGTPLEGYIAMKTGSMTGIQCYAGYKLDDNYMPTHVIVIMMNEMGDRTAARKEVEKMLLRIFPN